MYRWKSWGEVYDNFIWILNVHWTGRSGLGFRSDGSRQTFPMDLHYSIDRWHVHHSLRGTGPPRQHETDRHGIFLRGPATIPSSRWLFGNSRVEIFSCRREWAKDVHSTISRQSKIFFLHFLVSQLVANLSKSTTLGYILLLYVLLEDIRFSISQNV